MQMTSDSEAFDRSTIVAENWYWDVFFGAKSISLFTEIPG